MAVDVSPYDPTDDRESLWHLKRAFELELGSATGDDDKRETYEGKLTDTYRERYLEWVDRCLADDSHAVLLATVDDETVGYVFVLPDSFAYIWDAAVLNELYVDESHRGTGVADALLEEALSVVRRQDLPLDRIVLDVDPDNERARAFYDRHGFERWGELLARTV